MDYYDMEVKLGHIAILKDSLWSGDFGLIRSPSLSPIYIERFRGERTRVPFGYHKFWEFVCVMNGEGKFMVEGRADVPLVDSRIFLIPPNTSHAEYSEKKTEIIWVGCKGTVFNKFSIDKVLYTTYPDLAGKFLDLWKLSCRGYGNIGMELDGRCLDILGCFQRLLKEGEVHPDQNIVEKAVSYINEHFADDIDIAELSKKLNCSEGHFYRLFKKRIGMTPVSYISKVRIQNAAQWLMRSDLKLSQISNLVGYHDQFYFSRIFKKITGTSPKAYRDRRQSDKLINPQN
ncbi:MAG TPA: hypothetical protein DCZ94_11950 [Lentisphaeria bacterium]|nr:MAG: hypothetical protein A2X48_09455 [Lentisphaerae bacterium GWF2_49_21]HBC87661.1 hypothetical protein [Lentisphaeria bacterium]